MMTLANALTMSRIVFAFIIGWLLYQNILVGHMLAALCFLLAALSDLYDGYFARKTQTVTDFGKIMDPIADKVLMLTLFFVLSAIGMVHIVMVVIIAIREIAVTVHRLWVMSKGHVLAAEKAGKIKTVLQMVSVSFILLYLIAEQWVIFGGIFPRIGGIWLIIINILMYLTVLMTVISGVSYFKQARALSSKQS